MRGKLALVLMGRAMLSKSLIQFSVDGWVWVPYLLFTSGQTMVEVMKIMVTSFRRSHACTATLSARSPAAGHCQPLPPLETPGHSQASLGQVCLCHPRVCPQFCVSSGGSIVEIMAISSKRVYATPRSAAPRAPAPGAVHC